MKKIRVLVIEDSAVVQRLLEHTINRDPRLEVVGIANSAETALRLLPRLAPDVVTMDIRLPGINGFEATRRIMREHPVPIVVVAADVDDVELNISMSALRAGALAVVEKPGGVARADYEALAAHLCTQLVIMSQVQVVRQHVPRQPAPPVEPPPQPQGGSFRYLALVASTGGPNALVKVLSGLPTDFPLPILVVQHIGPNFVAGFASWLESVCPFPASLARHGERPKPGHIHVAPANVHLAVGDGSLRLLPDAPICGQRPAGDVLFTSLARSAGKDTIGVLLTGMGSDGAEGLLTLRREGAYTIAEDASTAVVYGMPGAASALGAAVEDLPLPDIAPRLRALVTGKESS